MKKLAFLFILFCYFKGIAAAPSYEAWWKAANTFYTQKQYDSAAFYFEKIAAQDPAEAVVYYNLGNTYYRLNQVGPAVLNYERAIHLDPSNNLAKDNLALTQSRISNRIQASPDIFFVKWWKGITRGSNAGAWAIASLLLFIVIIGLLLGNRFGKLHTPPQATGIVAGIWVLCIIIAFFAARRHTDSSRAVVMQNDAPLRADPRQSKSQSLVPEGTTVQWKNTVSGWVEVTLPDGRTGWMQQELLVKI